MCRGVKHVEGENRGEVKLYGLSTCLWCMRTKKLLDKLGVAYQYVDVDLQSKEEQQKIMEKVKQYNRLGSFPTIIINDACIVGYREDDIKGALGHGR
jgi:glutaredoxin